MLREKLGSGLSGQEEKLRGMRCKASVPRKSGGAIISGVLEFLVLGRKLEHGVGRTGVKRTGGRQA